MYTNLTGQSYGFLHANYGAHQPGQGRRCVNSVRAALTTTFGPHQGNSDLAQYVVQLCHGKTVRQCRRILNTSILFQPMWAQIGWPASVSNAEFVQACMRGLRQGRCFRHQGARRPAHTPRHRVTFSGHTSAHRVAYGQDDVILEETGETEEEAGRQQAPFDPVIFKAIMDQLWAGIGTIGGLAGEAETRRLTRDAIEAAGGDADANEDAINNYLAGVNAAGGDPTALAALQAELEAQIAQQNATPAWGAGAVLGATAGGLGLIVLTVMLLRKQGNSAQFYPVY